MKQVNFAELIVEADYLGSVTQLNLGNISWHQPLLAEHIPDSCEDDSEEEEVIQAWDLR